MVKPMPSPAPSPGEIAGLFPQLEILECLGQGGMGAVYKARQPKLDRFIALKILLRRRVDGTADAAFAERFAREARALARLNHPDIVGVYDYGEAGGYSYLLMEFVDGLTLRQLLQRGKLAPEEALAIVPKICAALQFAHQQGIVHRDIKPENILIDKQGQVKIADFGIAKILSPGAQDLSLTGGKDVVGTPHYMAPEQIEQPAKVDHRADLFSLGVVLYEMLTGELPLGKFAPPSKKVQVDVRLDEVVLHALEKEPARRYQHASEVKTDVEAIARTTAKPSVPAGATPVAARETGAAGQETSQRSLAFGIGIGIGLLVFLASALVTFSLPKSYVAAARVSLTSAIFKDTRASDLALLAATERQVIMRSPTVLSQVKVKLDLPRRWGARYGKGTLSDAAVRALIQNSISVRMAEGVSFDSGGIERPPLLEIRFWGDSPAEAAEIANAIAASYCQTRTNFQAQLVDAANPPLRASRPNIPLNLVIGGGLGLGLGFLSAGLTRWWAGPRRSRPADKGAPSAGAASSSRFARVCRWGGRVLGSLWALMFLLFVIGEGSPPLGQQLVVVQVEFTAIGLMLIGIALGWKWDGVTALFTWGGWLLFHLAEGRVQAGSLFHVPALVGVLFALAWLRGHSLPRRREVGWSLAIVAFPLLLSILLNSVFSRSFPPPGSRRNEAASLPGAATTAAALESPRTVVAEWLRRVKAGTRDAWDLTTRGDNAGWGPDLTGLWEFDRIRPAHQLGNDEQAMVVSNAFHDNAGRKRVFYAVLLKREGKWLIDRHDRVSADNVAGLMEGFKIHPGVEFDVRPEELIGEWGAPCLSLTLAADGTGVHLQTGPGPAGKPESIKWELSGSTLVIHWANRESRWGVVRVDDDSFQVDYTPGGVRGQFWTWYRARSAAAPDPESPPDLK